MGEAPQSNWDLERLRIELYDELDEIRLARIQRPEELIGFDALVFLGNLTAADLRWYLIGIDPELKDFAKRTLTVGAAAFILSREADVQSGIKDGRLDGWVMRFRALD